MNIACPIYRPDCGCDAMELSRDKQARHKRERVVHALTQSGTNPALANLNTLIADTALTPPDLYYRSKAQWVYAHTSLGPALGAYARGTHQVLPLRECVVVESALATLVPTLEVLLQEAKVRPYDERQHQGELRYVAARANHAKEALLTLVGPAAAPPPFAHRIAAQLMQAHPHLRGVSWHGNASKGNNFFTFEASRLLAGSHTFIEQVSGLQFELSVETFFQVHREAAHALRQRLLHHARPLLADAATPPLAWDLFCGVGVNALTLAQAGFAVTGVESHQGAVQAARQNAQRNSLAAHFEVGDLSSAATLPMSPLLHDRAAGGPQPHPSLVVLNPSRKGASVALLHGIASRLPERIIYIACEPKPLALAVEIFASQYDIVAIEPFDLFPQTNHVETLLVWQRTKGR